MAASLRGECWGTAAKNGTYMTLVKDGAQGNDGLMSLSGWICEGLNPSNLKRIDKFLTSLPLLLVHYVCWVSFTVMFAARILVLKLGRLCWRREGSHFLLLQLMNSSVAGIGHMCCCFLFNKELYLWCGGFQQNLQSETNDDDDDEQDGSNKPSEVLLS